MIADPASGVGDAFPVQFLSQIVNFVAFVMEKKPSVRNAVMKITTIFVWVRVVIRLLNVK